MNYPYIRAFGALFRNTPAEIEFMVAAAGVSKAPEDAWVAVHGTQHSKWYQMRDLAKQNPVMYDNIMTKVEELAKGAEA